MSNRPNSCLSTNILFFLNHKSKTTKYCFINKLFYRLLLVSERAETEIVFLLYVECKGMNNFGWFLVGIVKDTLGSDEP